MFAGYLTKRTTPTGAATILQRSYCVLWGTLLFDYETEEDSKQLSTPKATLEVLGVSEWDGGTGRPSRVTTAFLVVSHTGMKYYMTAATQQERDEWILHIRRALECNFANPSVVPYKPCKVKQNRPTHSFDRICAKTRNTIASIASATICKVCGRAYSSSDYVQEYAPFIQIGQEDSERCCLDCKNAQSCVLWLKCLNYVHVMTMHEFCSDVVTDIQRYESSFQLRKRLSHRLEMASQLLSQNQITAVEFEELRKIDQEYRVESIQEASAKFAVALDAIGQNMLMIIGLLINPTSTEAGGRATYYQVIVKLLEIADHDPALVDFYLPQIMQAHLLESMHRTSSSFIKVDLLQQALLVLAKRFPALALKMSWSLIAVLGDYNEKKVTQAQYACCACLLLQLEMIVCGEISSVCDNPLSTALADIIRPCSHQKQELCNEISSLFLSRRRLQEIYEEEEQNYKNHKLKEAKTQSKSSAKQSLQNPIQANTSSSSKQSTCLELLRNLGVGQQAQVLAIEPASPASTGSASSHGSKGSTGSRNRDLATREAASYSCDAEYDIGYCEQIRFIDRLSELVESLRFIHRQTRTEALCRELSKWNQADSMLGWDPSVLAGEPSYKLKRIVVEDCRVFRTKARAPSLIVCEVLRQDIQLDSKGRVILSSISNHSPAEELHVLNQSQSSHAHHLSPMRASTDSGDDDNFPVQVVHKRRSSSILADSAEAYMRTGDILQVDGLVDQSISQAIEELQSKDAVDNEAVNMDALNLAYELNNSEEYQVNIEDDNYSENNRISIEQRAKHELESDLHREPPHKPSQQQQPHQLQAPVTPPRRPSAPASVNTMAANSHTGASMNSNGIASYQNSNNAGSPRRSTGNLNGNGPPSASKLHSTQSFSVFKAALETVTDVGNTMKDARDKSGPQLRGMLKRIIPISPQSSKPNSGRTFSPFAFAGESSQSQPQTNSTTFSHSHSASDLQSLSRNSQEGLNSSRHSDGSFSAKSTTNTNGNSKKVSSQLSNLLNPSRITQFVTGGVNGSDSNAHGRGRSVSSDFLNSSSSASQAFSSRSSNPNLSPPDDSFHNKLVVQNAKKLLQEGKIDNAEYEMLVSSDGRYQHESAKVDEELTMTRVESAYGESWQAKKERILGPRAHITDTTAYPTGTTPTGSGTPVSAHLTPRAPSQASSTNSTPFAIATEQRSDLGGGHIQGAQEQGQNDGTSDTWPIWDLRCFIVKSNDDLRQEVCCLQIMQLCKEIFEEFGLSSQLWLKPYRIVSTGSNTGIVQVLPDTMSLDALKKTSGFQSLPFYFKSTYGSSPERISVAKHNFMTSLAAYSLFSYILSIKDRHNGNILLDTEGHIIHIDFGFMLSIAPGGSFSIETAPFKLTEEMVDVLGGFESKLFGEFVKAFTAGFYALRANAETIISTLQILAQNSPYPCFIGKDVNVIIDKLRSRFRNDLSVKEVVQHCLDLIVQSYGNYGTKQYDSFQWYTNGIVP